VSAYSLECHGQAIAAKGLPLICLIRLCPIAYPWSNAFFGSLNETVSLAHFMLATLTITPKLFLHVWVGTRIYYLACVREHCLPARLIHFQRPHLKIKVGLTRMRHSI
jgi:uncharacterized membrane protein YdjX (TVP38/TMEM64 family)